jgi:hypothetical protein
VYNFIIPKVNNGILPPLIMFIRNELFMQPAKLVDYNDVLNIVNNYIEKLMSV